MKADINIDVHHLTRVEGHGNIHIKVKGGKLVESKWEVVETPRFFEVMLRGLYHDMAPTLTSRICGICSIGHTLASLRAVENSLEIQILESIDIIDELLGSDSVEIRSKYDVKEGEGVGAVEVPRGILYHHYKIDADGKISKANCIIPTTQNHANIHQDLSELVKQEVAAGKDDMELTKLCEMLVRAYDPCISCSVH